MRCAANDRSGAAQADRGLAAAAAIDIGEQHRARIARAGLDPQIIGARGDAEQQDGIGPLAREHLRQLRIDRRIARAKDVRDPPHVV